MRNDQKCPNKMNDYSGGRFLGFHTRSQSGQFYMINVLENQWLSGNLYIVMVRFLPTANLAKMINELLVLLYHDLS